MYFQPKKNTLTDWKHIRILFYFHVFFVGWDWKWNCSFHVLSVSILKIKAISPNSFCITLACLDFSKYIGVMMKVTITFVAWRNFNNFNCFNVMLHLYVLLYMKGQILYLFLIENCEKHNYFWNKLLCLFPELSVFMRSLLEVSIRALHFFIFVKAVWLVPICHNLVVLSVW